MKSTPPSLATHTISACAHCGRLRCARNKRVERTEPLTIFGGSK